MIDLNATNEWQHRDPSNGLVFPWYVKSFLDELVTWDLSDKVVFEYGAGASTLWWAKKCKAVRGVESNGEYAAAIWSLMIPSIGIAHLENKDQYVNHVNIIGRDADIIIIDGEPIEWRDACVQPALNCLKPGGRLIIDNWMQESVGWLPSKETRRILSQYPVQVYHQDGHPDWKTAVWTI